MTASRDRAEIVVEVEAIFAGRLGLVGVGPLDDGTMFFADLGLASIDAVVLGEALRDRYGRDLPFGDLMASLGRLADRDLSIGELVDFLQMHLN